MFSFLWKVPDTAVVDAVFSEAYACLEQGLCYDEVNDYENTVLMYERGLNLMKEGQQMKNAKKSELYKMLMEAKQSVERRLDVLRREGPKKTDEKKEKGEVEIDKSVENEKAEIRMHLESFGGQEADLIYFLPEGVQLFTIDGDKTTAPTQPTSLQILKFPTPEKDGFQDESDEATKAFIQIGPWVYPLMKNKTPILKNEFGAYVVANPTPDSPNMMVAILLSQDIEPRLVEELEIVLKEFADYKEQEKPVDLTKEEKNRISSKIAKFLISSGERIAWGVGTTTVKVVSQVEDNGDNVVYIHKGTKVVAKCTRYLLDKIGDMGVSIGKSFAEGAQKRFGDGKTGGLVSGTIEILGGGITGVSTVWISLEDGSKTLCRSIANQTVQNVKIKYGDDASETTHHALFAAGHGTLAAAQLWDLGPRSVAGRMARKAGIQMVSDLHGKRGQLYVDDTKLKKPL